MGYYIFRKEKDVCVVVRTKGYMEKDNGEYTEDMARLDKEDFEEIKTLMGW